jgi:hypothetical protein
MKKILAIIMIFTSLFMKPLLAPKSAGLQAIHERQKEILKEKQQRLTEAEEAKKVKEQEEKRAQQELQEKEEAERAQEQRARDVAADKKREEQQRVLKLQKVQEGSDEENRLLSMSMLDVLTAAEKYGADNIKEGDALVFKVGDTLRQLGMDRIRQVFQTVTLQPEKKFILMSAMADALALRDAMAQKSLEHMKELAKDPKKAAAIQNVLDAKRGIQNILGAYLSVLFDSFKPEELGEFLSKKANANKVTQIATRLMRVVNPPQAYVSFDKLDPSEKIFLRMIDFTSKLIEALNILKPSEQSDNVANVVLNWVRHIPFTNEFAAKQLRTGLQHVRVETLPADAAALRDWFLILKDVSDKDFLHDVVAKYVKVLAAHQKPEFVIEGMRLLKKHLPKDSWRLLESLVKPYMDAVVKRGDFGELFDAVQIISDPDFREYVSFKDVKETMQLKRAFLRAAAHSERLVAFAEDPALHELMQEVLISCLYTNLNMSPDAGIIWTDFVHNLDDAIALVEKSEDPSKDTILKNLHDSQMLVFNLFSPRIIPLLPSEGNAAWKKLVETYTKETRMRYAPRYLQERDPYRSFIFEESNPSNFHSLTDLLPTFQALARAIDWYADFPQIQQALIKAGDDFYRTISNHVEHNLEAQEKEAWLAPHDVEKFWIHVFELPQHLRDLIEHLFYESGKKFKNLSGDIASYVLVEAIENNNFHALRNLPEAIFKEALAEQGAVFVNRGTLALLENMSDKQFAMLMGSLQKIADDTSLHERLAQWIHFVSQINPQRAVALLKTLEAIRASGEEKWLEGFPLKAEDVKTALADAEKRLKVQQESEAKTKASAETSASTSSVSSGIASTTSTSSSSANVTTSSSASSTSSSMSALSRGIGALTQSRS